MTFYTESCEDVCKLNKNAGLSCVDFIIHSPNRLYSSAKANLPVLHPTDNGISIIFKIIREGVKKNRFFGTLFQTMGRWGSKVPNSLVKATIQSFLLQKSRNVPKHAIRGWVGVQSPKQIHGILSEKFLIFQKNKMLQTAQKAK